MIRYTSGTSGGFDRDGFGVINNDLFHRVWGRGLAQDVLRALPTEALDGRIHVSFRNIFTFPAHPTIAP